MARETNGQDPEADVPFPTAGRMAIGGDGVEAGVGMFQHEPARPLLAGLRAERLVEAADGLETEHVARGEDV